MTNPRRVAASVLAVGGLLAALGLAACATTPAAAPGGAGALEPDPPTGEVIAQATVIDAGEPVLCLGGVQESLPPQCVDGIRLIGWEWDGLEGAETASGTTWGAYAVQGTYDGTAFTVTRTPVLLALYDPLALPDPTGGVPGSTPDEELYGVQQRMHDTLGSELLVSAPYDGRLWVTVVWDDGTVQAAADAEFGDDVVVVQSALRAVAGD